MSTVGRFRWLKALLSLILLLGMAAPTLAEDDVNPDNGVEQYFWLCLIDHQGRTTESGNWHRCCDGGACYSCTSDFSLCRIDSDPSSSGRPQLQVESIGLNIREMQERPSKGQLQTVCSSVKANFTSLEGLGFSCVKPDCNGKGDYCSILCLGDRRCTAGTPDVIKGAVSLRGILQNGDNIKRGNASSGISSGGDNDRKDSGGGGGGDEGPCGPDGCLY